MALRLRHIHLPSAPARGIFPPYASASALQELLRRQFLNAKDNGTISQVPPTLISFTPQPTFTLGRRQAEAALSSAELARLKAPLRISSPGGHEHVFEPAVVASPRGGLTTYHGPGQVVLWPVLDLKSPRHRQFSVRCYSRLLETTTIAVLARLWGLRAFTTEDPGVWVRSPAFPAAEGQQQQQQQQQKQDEEETRKIAALGVHLRRHVSALGTAINLSMPTTRGVSGAVPSSDGGASAPVTDEGGGESTNPWTRFVACGLEGKGVTCVAAETQAALEAGGVTGGDGGAAVGGDAEGGRGTAGLEAGAVASAWAAELARALGVEGVDEVDEVDVERLLVEAKDQGPAGYVSSVEEAL